MKYDYGELPHALASKAIQLGTKLKCRECLTGYFYSVGKIYTVQERIYGYAIGLESEGGWDTGLNGWDGKWEIYCDLPKTPLEDYL